MLMHGRYKLVKPLNLLNTMNRSRVLNLIGTGSMIYFFPFLFFLYAGATAQTSTVGLIRDGERWNLAVNGQPVIIKGVVGHTFLEKAKAYGCNSVRTSWRAEQLAQVSELGMHALVNLPARAERDGMNYDDTTTVKLQTEELVSIVKATKDHPAVLMWAIGNELDYIPPLQPFNPKVWDAVNQVAKAIHDIDPHHPVMTVIGTSMMHKVADIVKRCPDIDLLGINSYGDL